MGVRFLHSFIIDWVMNNEIQVMGYTLNQDIEIDLHSH
jgi:hypothetical protein